MIKVMLELIAIMAFSDVLEGMNSKHFRSAHVLKPCFLLRE